MSALKNWRTLFTVVALLGLAFSLTARANAQTPAPQAAGDPRIVSGVVRDGTPGGHTWPLYARIDIAGFSGSPIFTNPVNGAYAVSLEEGTTYEFTVSAVQGGYLPFTQSVTGPVGDLTVDFGLQVEEIFCEAPGYALVDHWTENFDSVTVPALPANWMSQDVIGYPDPWVTGNTVNLGNGYPAHSGSNFAKFSSNSGIARLRPAVPVDMTALPNHHLTFWMFQDGGYPNQPEALRVMVSADNGQTWAQAGTEFNYYGSSTGWFKQVVDLSAYASQTSLLFGFESSISYSSISRRLYVDTISLSATCEAQAGALVTGQVLDANTNQAINGVKVQSSVDETFSQATPLDAVLGDGNYSVFALAGEAVAISAAKIPFQPLTENLNLVAETIVAHDLRLDAGQLAADLNSITLSLPKNSTETVILNLNNSGGVVANFTLSELNRSTAGASSPLPYAYAGEVLSNFSTGINFMGGLAYNPFTDELWIQDRQDVFSPAGDDRLVRFLTDSTATGDTIALTSATNSRVTDFVFNPRTGTLWVPGSDSCIHEFDPVSRQATGQHICPAVGLLTLLAYDPISDTYFGGRIDTNTYQATFLFRFTPQGDILKSSTINRAADAVAFNPATGHLFTLGGSTFYIWDVNNDFLQDGVIYTGLPSGQFGLEFDCSGSLWAVIASESKVYEIASGESGACDWMNIPWLSAAPSVGSIPAGGTLPVTLTFDSTGLMPGTYTAQLNLSHDTPYNVARLPVTLIIESTTVKVYLPLIKR
ncbi:MAG: hypothetical protein GYA40_09025 [Chloroflexi bacterium]|nr:hypothetical protein [Chloroflexota bacterium]